MLAKKTVKNQITLPKAALSPFPGVDYFEISTDGSCIVLRPLRPSQAEEVRTRLRKLGITEGDVSDAVKWARKRK